MTDDELEALIQRRIKEAVTAALNDAAEEIRVREGELLSLLRRRSALTPELTRGMAKGFKQAAEIVRART